MSAPPRNLEETILTDHIVAVLIPNQGLRRTFTLVVDYGQGGDDLIPFLLGSKLNALFDDVAGKLVLGKDGELRDDKANKLGSMLISTMLDNVLSHIIAKLVQDER